ncbi:leucine-rich repeat domain-containing protein [Microcoleus sp. Pol7_A1]|uniref:leucine-rich repeat domain-containing protein n=1 Tax=Microcoleus sp. Pol7_A1 TaxID=2818893 RepID=UPI002FCF1F9B
MSREEVVRRIEWNAEKKLEGLKLKLGKRGLKELPLEIVKYTHLIDLEFTSCNNVTSIPDALGQLSNLKRLSLRKSRITSIPDALGQLSNLTVLNLSNNRITSIPDALGQLSNLTVLNLSDNQITSIPDTLSQLSNLRELNLSDNQITKIPEAIRSLKKLEKLDLRGNPLPLPPQLLKQGQEDEGCGNLRTILDFYFHTRNSALPELDTKHQKIESEEYFGAETLPDSKHQKIESQEYFDPETLPDFEHQKIESEEYFDAETLQDARQRITASIVQRQGQPEFRHKLLIAYAGRCPITDCDVELAIEAAHIIPYQGTQTNHLSNGLPLRADIHTLFDLHLLSIRPNTNEVVIAPELVGTCYQHLAARKLTLPQDKKTAPNQNALSKHYETFLSKCKSGQL